MSTVYIFGGSAEVITNNPHITSIVEAKDFDYENNVELFSSRIIKDFIVDKKIEIANALVQFYEEDAYKTIAIYWTNKILRLYTWSNMELPRPPNLEYIDYDIGGNEHNVSHINISINKNIEASKIFSVMLLCSKNYTIRKPDNIILADVAPLHLTPQQNHLPFKHATVKLYYKWVQYTNVEN